MDIDSRDAAAAGVPIDEKTIQELREEGGDLLSDLVQMFIDEVPGQLAILNAALAKEDAGAVRLTAHTLKGTAANFGASLMQALASALEMKGRDGSFEGAAALLVQLQAECERVRAALEAAR
ncbi:MAG TPA: Hpt domain-containing protein [Candidatus Binataceae bacterium]|jgi:HPt (histidine-containing phosphotransfer) domain-containing protein